MHAVLICIRRQLPQYGIENSTIWAHIACMHTRRSLLLGVSQGVTDFLFELAFHKKHVQVDGELEGEQMCCRCMQLLYYKILLLGRENSKSRITIVIFTPGQEMLPLGWS
jgi:hypothetical protein